MDFRLVMNIRTRKRESYRKVRLSFSLVQSRVEQTDLLRKEQISTVRRLCFKQRRFSLEHMTATHKPLLFQHLTDAPKLKPFGQGIQEQQKRVAVDRICKLRLFGF